MSRFGALGAPLSMLLLVLSPSDSFVSSPPTFFWRPRATTAALPAPRAVTTSAASPRAVNADPLVDPTRGRGVPDLEGDADEVFSVVDTNGDGEISRDELRGHLLSCGYTEVAVGAIFRTLDTNSDDAISRAEFAAAFLKVAMTCPIRNPSLDHKDVTAASSRAHLPQVLAAARRAGPRSVQQQVR
jgi:hypothetical protein